VINSLIANAQTIIMEGAHASLKKQLEEIAAEKAPGPSPSFSVLHVLLAIEYVAENPTGRKQLAEMLGVGEGVARTIIERLRAARLVAVSREGCFLTEEGLRLHKRYGEALSKAEIGKNELTLADSNVAVLVRNCVQRVRSGMEQRDEAVRMGAKGATTLLFRNGRLRLPSSDIDVDRTYPRFTKEAMNVLRPRDNDVMIVVSAETRTRAELGALAAAWTVLNCS